MVLSSLGRQKSGYVSGAHDRLMSNTYGLGKRNWDEGQGNVAEDHSHAKDSRKENSRKELLPTPNQLRRSPFKASKN